MRTYKQSTRFREENGGNAAAAQSWKPLRATPGAKDALPRVASPATPKGWSAEIVADEKTRLVTLIVKFRTRDGRSVCHRVPADRREEFSKIRRELLGYDADFAGPPSDDIKLLKR